MSKLTLEEIKAKTLELLNSKDIVDVEYITQELIDKDISTTYEDAGLDLTVDIIHGHNVRYGYNNGLYGYVFERGANWTGTGCGNSNTTWADFNMWHGTSIGRCTGNDHLVEFRRR